MNHRQSAFTMLEMLVVLAIISIMVTIGYFSLQRYQAGIVLSDATRVVTDTLNQARGAARQTSSDQVVSWTNNSNTITLNTTTTVKFPPGGVTLTGTVIGSTAATGGSVTYSAPYATFGGSDLEITLSGQFGLTSRIRVIGVMGKVIRVAN